MVQIGENAAAASMDPTSTSKAKGGEAMTFDFCGGGGPAGGNGQQSLQDRFKRFRRERKREHALSERAHMKAACNTNKSNTAAAVFQSHSSVEESQRCNNTAARRETLRKRFVDGCLSYVGVPYAQKKHEPGDPDYDAPIFLDCCGLVRKVLLDLEEDFGFRVGKWNQAYQFETLGGVEACRKFDESQSESDQFTTTPAEELVVENDKENVCVREDDKETCAAKTDWRGGRTATEQTLIANPFDLAAGPLDENTETFNLGRPELNAKLRTINSANSNSNADTANAAANAAIITTDASTDASSSNTDASSGESEIPAKTYSTTQHSINLNAAHACINRAIFSEAPCTIGVKAPQIGDLVFVEGSYFDESKKPQKHRSVHVEVYIGEGVGEDGVTVHKHRTVGSRWARSCEEEKKVRGVKIHNSYRYVSKQYEIHRYIVLSIDPWLDGRCRSQTYPDCRGGSGAGSGINRNVNARYSIFGEAGDSSDEDADAEKILEKFVPFYAVEAEAEAGAGSREKTAYVGEGNNHKAVMEALQQRGFSILPFDAGYSGRFDLKWVEQRGKIDYHR